MKVFLILAAITLLVRLPFFFPDVLDPDEGTFILMGQDILDGNLPYEKLWDIKPPLLPYCFAAMIALFGKTIPAVRFGGALCVLMAAFLVYLLGERLKNSRTGFVAGVLFIIFSLPLSSGSTDSEILAAVPLTAAALVVFKDKPGTTDFFLFGLLVSTACMFRLNLAYVALFGGICLLLPGKFLKTDSGVLRRVPAYVAGGFVPMIMLCLPFVLTGKQKLLVTPIQASLGYSTQLSFPEAIYRHAARLADPWYAFGYSLILIGSVCGLVYTAYSWKKFSGAVRTRLAVVLFFLLTTSVSTFKTGQAFEHYLIQVLPFASLIAAFFLDRLLDTGAKAVAVAAAALCLVGPVQMIAGAYKPVVSRALDGKALVYGPAYELAEYLKEVNPDNEPVYFMTGHIAQWFNNAKPVSAIVTHPNNIGREYLVKALSGPSATVESELDKILSKEPAFIVKQFNVHYLKPHPEAQRLLSEKLFMDYELVHTVGDYLVFKHF